MAELVPFLSAVGTDNRERRQEVPRTKAASPRRWASCPKMCLPGRHWVKPHIQGTAFPVTELLRWLPGAQPTWDEGGYGRSQPFETEPAVEVRSTHSQACWALSTSGVGNPPGSCGNAGAGAAWQNSGSLSGRCSRIKFPRCSQGSDLKPGGPGPPVPDGATDRPPLAKSDDIGKKLIFLGSRNSRALKCRTQGKLC